MAPTPLNESDYLAIEDHAAIGNLRTVALVGRDGSIAWLCLPDLDDPSVFASLLDPDRGGRFRIAPSGRRRLGGQRYLDGTNIVETTFDTDGGRLVVTDFLPLRGSLDEPRSVQTEPVVHRLLRAEGGHVDVEVVWAPRFGYGAAATRMGPTARGWLAHSDDAAMAIAGLDRDETTMEEDRVGPVLRARVSLRDGEQRAVTIRWGDEPASTSVAEVEDRLAVTHDAWHDWVHKAQATGDRAWAGDHADLVIRSELVLKLLTHADSGAIAAAATTSLPEEVGGVRNWDYRYSWIRDAGLAAQALFALGHRTEAHAFVTWAERAARDEGSHSWGLQIVYGLHGGTDMPERDLPGLAGWRRSAPVRVGNEAVDQLQLDIYGELISAAYEIVRLGGELDDDILAFLPHVADQACVAWREDDYGLWELRNGPSAFVYSKVMVWMALDRACRIARNGLIDGDVERWRQTKDEITEDVLAHGFDDELGAFKQAYERPVLDASNVLLPLQEFLPVDHPRVQRTLDRTLEELTDNGLVYRYLADDGIAGGEGGFGLCTFWVADALALSGRVDEAEALYETMVGHANHVGLYSEQIDPASGAFLGNFPQAFTHLGLINTSLYLAAARGQAIPLPSLIGSPAHREDD